MRIQSKLLRELIKTNQSSITGDTIKKEYTKELSLTGKIKALRLIEWISISGSRVDLFLGEEIYSTLILIMKERN
jgi:hypothetical protein